MTHGRVDQQEPSGAEYQHGGKTHSLGKTTDDERWGNDRKRELKHHK